MPGTTADAIHENYIAALALVAAVGPHSELARYGDLLLIDAGMDEPSLNTAVLVPGAANAAFYLAMAERWFAARRQPIRVIAREGLDQELAQAALEAGYQEWFREPGLVFEGELLPVPALLDVHRVDSAEGAAEYARIEPGRPEDTAVAETIARAAAGASGCDLFVGRLDGVAVARAMVFVTGEAAGIYNVYVRPEHRRLGLGRAMTLAAMAAGRSRGARIFGLQATPEGAALYRAMGFEHAYELVSYCRPV
ncbi:MAG: GNAT family N-acetyltransferase [Dehalococcoidia bacterium]|nr:GNAT family N-acetyltransferase [Dehalococcoidia bacterium]